MVPTTYGYAEKTGSYTTELYVAKNVVCLFVRARACVCLCVTTLNPVTKSIKNVRFSKYSEVPH